MVRASRVYVPRPPRTIVCEGCGGDVVLRGPGTAKTTRCADCRDKVFSERERLRQKEKGKRRRDKVACGLLVPKQKEKRKRRRDKVVRGLLTPRQKAVLEYLRDGCSALEVADTLMLSVLTVKLHVVAIRRRLRARNTTQAVVVAIRKGLIELGDGK